MTRHKAKSKIGRAAVGGILLFLTILAVSFVVDMDPSGRSDRGMANPPLAYANVANDTDDKAVSPEVLPPQDAMSKTVTRTTTDLYAQVRPTRVFDTARPNTRSTIVRSTIIRPTIIRTR